MADPLSYIRDWRERFLAGGWWHSFELPDGTLIQGVSDLAAQKRRIAQFPIPENLAGKRVLDIGAWDGWFSFEMERRGAEVLAIDRFDNPRFHEIRERLASRVEYRQVDVYEVSPRTLGYFDIVLFMGVLYHLKHPLAALERVCSITREMAAVESFVLAERHGLPPELEKRNLIQFFEDDDFGGQTDNWCAPTTAALLALCRTAGFARAQLNNRHDYGAAVTCYRQWGAEARAGRGPAPQLLAAANADNFGINFSSAKDDYVACCFAGGGTGIARDTVFPEAGGLGIRPLFAGVVEGGYAMVWFKLPPGLEPGWHEVRLRTAGSLPSNGVAIAVDLETSATRLEIKGACDGTTWQPGQVSLANGFLSVWAAGLPENADLHNVALSVGERRQRVTFVGAPDAKGVRQVNARVEGVGPGTHPVVVAFGKTRSAALPVTVVT